MANKPKGAFDYTGKTHKAVFEAAVNGHVCRISLEAVREAARVCGDMVKQRHSYLDANAHAARAETR